MLYWSEGVLALSPDGTLQNTKNPLDPFNAESTAEVIEETLQKLHDEAIAKNFKTSARIEALLLNRRARLKTMIAYIDVEASLHSLTREFIYDLFDDFSLHIHTVIDVLPTPERYVNNYDDVKKSFLKANYAFDGALDTLEDATVAKRENIQDILNEKKIAYTTLHTTTDLLEAGFSHWKILQIPPVKGKLEELGLEKYLEFEGGRLKEQIASLRGIKSGLIGRGSNFSLDEEQLSDFECLMRETVLKTLLTIPERPLPRDPASLKQITGSKINKFYNYKSDIIKHLRAAKIALNLALDRYTLNTQQNSGENTEQAGEENTKRARIKRRDLDTYLEPCSESLDEIFKILRES